jgi:hypothetical protein
MDANQIAEIERAMRAEHQKDLEALARLKRFLPQNGTQVKQEAIEPIAIRDTPLNTFASVTPTEEAKSNRQRVAEIMMADPTKAWTAQMMVARLQQTGVVLGAKNPVPGIQLIMEVWKDRGKVDLIRKGTGRIPNLYRWKAGATLLSDSGEAAV